MKRLKRLVPALFLFATYPALAAFPTKTAHDIVAVFQKDLGSEVSSRHGVKLEVSFITDIPAMLVPYVAASADRYPGEWRISVWGGSNLAPAITADAFVLILCHEFGHHMGGSPQQREADGSLRWASAEGQADYYATAVCAKRMFSLIPAAARPPREMLDYCATRTKGDPVAHPAALACARSIAAARSVMEERSGKPFDWRVIDPSVVPETIGLDPDESKGGIYAYPKHDCMMDNFRRGALCVQVPHPTVTDMLGVSGRERFCEGEFGRPACWYAR
jgi:hypothetical protein